MKPISLDEMLENNPNVDRGTVEKALEMLQELKRQGVKSNSPSALPPTQPYGSKGTMRLDVNSGSSSFFS